MKCPDCGFVSFDDLDQCKRCGLDFVAYRRGDAPPRSSLLTRLRGKVTNGKDKTQADVYQSVLGDLDEVREATRRETTLRRERETATQNYLARERRIREEKAQLRRSHDRATNQNDRDNIRKQIEILAQRRKTLTEEKEAFEVRERALDKKMRDQTAMARLKVEQELKQAEASVIRRREREEAELKKMQSDLETQREKTRREQEEHQGQLAVERERLARERADLDKQKRLVLESEEAYQARITEQQRGAKEIADALREKEKQLASERERAREAQQQAEQLQSEAEEMISQMAQRQEEANQKESYTDEPTEPAKEKSALQGVDYDSMRQQWRQSLGSDRKPTPEDYLAMLRKGRRKAKRPAPETIMGGEGLKEPEESDEDLVFEELILDEEEDEDVEEVRPAVALDRRRVAAKGGLVRRSLAALIDLVLLMMVLGIFLVIGRLVTGSQGGNLRELTLALGLPFYLLFVLLAAAYVTYVHGTYGQTLGQRLLHMRVLTTHGEELTYLTAFFRFVAACFAVGLLGMGVVWIGLDPNKQGWHDKLARTVVVKA